MSIAERLLTLRLTVAVLFPFLVRYRTNTFVFSREYCLTSLSPANAINVVKATLTGVWSMLLRDRHSSAISDNKADLGLKLSMTEATSTWRITSLALQELSRTSLSRLEYSSASTGSGDKDCRMNDP